MSQKPPHVHETDVYLETNNATAHSPGRQAPAGNRFRTLLQPLVVGLMVSCIALAVTQCLQRFAPDWNKTYFLLIPLLAAFMGHTTYRVTRERYPSEADRRHRQIIELALIFLLTKAATYLNHTLPEIWDNIRHWPKDIFYLFDPETLIAFALACTAWFAAALTARDLDAVADPLLYKGETGPMERLNRRFLTGGVVLLFISGLARIDIISLLKPDRPAIHGLALNVLVYFVLGLIVLGQVRFTWLNRLWEQQKYHVAGVLQKTWLRYSVLFLLIALGLAFVLPTQYTVGLLDIARWIIAAIVYLATLIVALITALISFVASLFQTGKDGAVPSAMPSPTLPPLLTEPTSAGPSLPWLNVLRSVIFWVIVLGAMGYIVYSYLKERPEILPTIRAFKVTRMVRGWWHTLRTWWQGMRHAIRTTLPALSLDFLRRKASRQHTSMTRRKGEAWREQIFYSYLETLDRAREVGFPRHDTQTPDEYHRTLEPHLPEAQAELTALTAAFVEARYSTHPVDAHDVDRLQINARHVRAALDKLRAVSRRPSAVSDQPSATTES
ncbi:MAG TPA: DUF4129 domain-containing protein [Anaerolineae bacterium]|nr:DUF4129 domain-containing protein [Anaerolineae bacterium]